MTIALLEPGRTMAALEVAEAMKSQMNVFTDMSVTTPVDPKPLAEEMAMIPKKHNMHGM